MAIAKIADLWTPEIWIPGMREKQATFPSILNSGIAVTTPLFDEIASGAGVTVHMPFFKDQSDQADEIQVEDTAPTTLGITTGDLVTPILNRVTKNGVTALAAAVSGTNPVGEIQFVLTERRLKQREATLISMLRGAFGSAGAAAGPGALSGMRLDSFDESGNDATSDQTMGADLFISAKALMGQLAGELQGRGGILIHPNVLASLEIADALSFMPGVQSSLPFTITTYRGIPVFVSERLVRAGTTNGYVYDTYIFARGVVAKGEKPQVGGDIGNPVIDVASLNYVADVDKNNSLIYDRTRFVMALNGMKYGGTPAGQSATNAELAVVADWTYQYTTQNRAGIICIRTNK